MQNILSTGGSNSIFEVLGMCAPQPKLTSHDPLHAQDDFLLGDQYKSTGTTGQ